MNKDKEIDKKVNINFDISVNIIKETLLQIQASRMSQKEKDSRRSSLKVLSNEEIEKTLNLLKQQNQEIVDIYYNDIFGIL